MVPNVGATVDSSQTIQPRRAPASSSGGSAATGTGRYQAALGDEAALLNAAYQAELSKRGGFSPATPEREQRTHVQRNQAEGYDPELLREEEAIEMRPSDLAREVLAPGKAPAATYDPKAILQVFQPNEEFYGKKLTEKQKIAWATDLAKNLSERNIDPSTAVSIDNPSVRIVPMDDESRRFALDAIEAPSKRDRSAFEKAETARLGEARAVTDNAERELGGPGGIVGNLRHEKTVDQGILEDEAKAHEDLARVYADEAKARAEEMAARRDEDDPNGWSGIKSAIAIGLGGFGASLTGGKNYALEKALALDSRKAEKYAKTEVDRLGLQNARLKQIENELGAKKALGLSEKQRLAADRMLAEVRLKQIQTEKELSAAVRGTKATASAVIPARAASSGGGPSLDRLIAIAGKRRALEKEGVEVAGKAAEVDAKTGENLGRRVVADNITYDLTHTKPEEAKDYRLKLGFMDSMDSLLKQIKKESENYGTRAWNPNVLNDLITRYAYLDSNALGQGVVKEPEMEQKLRVYGSIGRAGQVIENARRNINEQRQAMLRQTGAVPVRK
jgi:hypothetical protein